MIAHCPAAVFLPGRRFGAALHPALNAVVGGWEFSNIYTFVSGTPLTFSLGVISTSSRPPLAIQRSARFSGSAARSNLVACRPADSRPSSRGRPFVSAASSGYGPDMPADEMDRDPAPPVPMVHIRLPRFPILR